jgi:hypothetical protein
MSKKMSLQLPELVIAAAFLSFGADLFIDNCGST